jgi:hypothetical protein
MENSAADPNHEGGISKILKPALQEMKDWIREHYRTREPWAVANGSERF